MSNAQREYEILDYVSSRSAAYRIDIINQFDPQIRCGETHALIEHLVDVGLLRFSPARSECLKLTPAGVHTLKLFRDSAVVTDLAKQDKIDQQTKEHAEKSKERRFQIELLLVGGLITLLVEHFDKLVKLISEFLEQS